MIKIINGNIVVRYMSEQTKETLWEIKETIIVELSNGSELIIPIGFITDFASVPKCLWSVVASIGKFNLASVIHDYLYTNHIYDRKFSDKEFLNFMNLTSTTKIRNYTMYIFVRMFGSKRWREQGL